MIVSGSKRVLTLVVLALAGGLAAAQDKSFTTTFQGGESGNGSMFDVVALRNLRLKRIDIHLASGAATVEIYARQNGFSGFQQVPSAWTLLGASAVTGQGIGGPTTLPIALDLVVPAGTKVGLYVTNTGGAGEAPVQYTPGLGQIFTDASDIAVLQGVGIAYPFGVDVPDKLFNGTIVYETLGLAGTPDQLSLTTGGVQTMSLSPGAQFAGLPYLLVGSLSGTSPGFFINGFTLPINVDVYTVLTLQNPNAAPLAGSFGFLDGLGLGSVTFTVPPNNVFPASLAGLTVHHAFVVIQLTPTTLGKVVFASEALPLTFTP